MIVKVVYVETDAEGDHAEYERVGFFLGISTGKLFLEEIKGQGCGDAIPVEQVRTLVMWPVKN